MLILPDFTTKATKHAGVKSLLFYHCIHLNTNLSPMKAA